MLANEGENTDDDYQKLEEALYDSDYKPTDDEEGGKGAAESQQTREQEEVVRGEEGVPPPPEPHPEARTRPRRARGIARPEPMTKAQLIEHDFEGHAKYHAGCEYCVRSRGLADRHERYYRNEADRYAKCSSGHEVACQPAEERGSCVVCGNAFSKGDRVLSCRSIQAIWIAIGMHVNVAAQRIQRTASPPSF